MSIKDEPKTLIQVTVKARNIFKKYVNDNGLRMCTEVDKALMQYVKNNSK